MSVIPFPASVDLAADRLHALHIDRLPLDELAADLGTPREWLATAVAHLKIVSCDGRTAGRVTVSVAALDLVLMRLEHLEHGGDPWRGNAA